MQERSAARHIFMCEISCEFLCNIFFIFHILACLSIYAIPFQGHFCVYMREIISEFPAGIRDRDEERKME